MTTPNFLIVGAAKAGTTSLYYYLRQHPQIYMSPAKEPSFFAFEGEKLDFPAGTISKDFLAQLKTDIESYCELFKGVSREIAIGEASAIYLYNPKAPERIKHYIPTVKLIAILRNPVERAYSDFLHHIREGNEPLMDFAQAIQEEEARIRNNWGWGFHYVQKGFYFTQLRRYFEKFNQNQIKVYLYEDLEDNPIAVLQDIFHFLGVDETFIPDTSLRYNVTGIPRSRLLHRFLIKPNFIKAPFKPLFPEKLRKRMVMYLKNRNLVKPPLPPRVRNWLIRLYRDDILRLQDLIQRDLSQWLV